MSSGDQSSSSSAAIPAGDDHPLAAGVTSINTASQPQSNSFSSRQQQGLSHQNAMASTPVGVVAGAVHNPIVPAVASKQPISAPPNSLSSGETNVSPSSK